MYADVSAKIARIQAQIEDVNYAMVEAEGDELFKLEDKLEQLENKLDTLMMMQNDMESASGYEE